MFGNINSINLGNIPSEGDKQEDALKLLSDLKKAGFDDAFVVAFKNNVRISLQEAQLIQPN